MSRYLVTAALPYANNRLHLGHVAGVYVPADIFVRYLRCLGEEVLFICGSDDHGVPITISAQKEGITPPAVVAKYRKLQEEVFRGLRVEFDIYSGTSTCPQHVAVSQQFFRSIHEQGQIVARDTEQFYCESCGRFLPDRYVEGLCPRCGAEGARGDQCDACGKSYEQTELRDPYCATCRNPPMIRKTRHWFFRLGEYEERLRSWLESVEGWRDNVRNFALGAIKEGLPERSITRDLDWGVPVPLPEAANKVLYVWFDAPVGYLSFTQQLFAERGDPEGWRRYWEDPATRLYHFIGKDNIIFHAVIWPAMLMGQRTLILPHDIPANEYLNFKGMKFSKSMGHAVWADEALAVHSADRLRYYLTVNSPEGRDTNFTWEDFVKRNNEELSDVLGNLCHRVFTFAARYLDARMPAGVGEHEGARELLSIVADTRDRWRRQLGECRIKEALGTVIHLAREGNRLFDAAEPWKTRRDDPARCALDIGSFLELVRALGTLLYPFLPDAAERLRGAFGAAAAPAPAEIEALGAPTLVPGSIIDPPGVLFPKLEG